MEIPCQFPECTYTATHADKDVAIALFQSHNLSHQASQNTAGNHKLPKVERPVLKQDVNDEDWCAFLSEWERFKKRTNMNVAEINDQLLECCERNLRRLVIKEDPHVFDEPEADLLVAIKRMAVIQTATSVRRTKLLQSKQEPNHTFREYYANVRASAATCKYSIKCPHTCCADKDAIDYTPLVVKDVIIAGILDSDIMKETLGWKDLDSKTDREVVRFVEEKEIARNAFNNPLVNTTSTAALSSYRSKKSPATTNAEEEVKKKLGLMGKCKDCHQSMNLYSLNRYKRINRNPYKLCSECFQSNRSNKQSAPPDKTSEAGALQSFIGAAQMTDGARRPSMVDVELDHHIFTTRGWEKAVSFSHPLMEVEISTTSVDYQHFNRKHPDIKPVRIKVVADSGAQSCLWSMKEFLDSGFKKTDLIPVKHVMKTASSSSIRIDGAVILRLHDPNSSSSIEAAVMVYISPDAPCFFLSKEALVQLKVLPASFPQVGDFEQPCSSAVEGGVTIHSANGKKCVVAPCGCLVRTDTPAKPTALPFECKIENVEKMKKWLLDRYASSTFNQCPHQKLPEMKGPPIKIHISENAVPVNLQTPAPVPLHWQDEVQSHLIRDENLDVLEQVPYGVPVVWCFRMVITRKSNGTLRRTVDLSPLNKFCKREIHPSETPFKLARSVPAYHFKTVMDAWNGFHSVPIREEDRHLTTFCTPWGLYRYKRAPQGYLSSGDGYDRRFADICAHIQRMQRCRDDTLLHDESMSEHWWRIIEFLDLCGNSGIVLNSDKFQFCSSSVDFAGFRINNDSVEPLPKYLEAIRDYPTPNNITDIRSWFGLVNQVSHYSQLRDMMEPFRKFLSPKTRFEWSDELNAIFEQSKKLIVDAIKEGVKIFDPLKRTALHSDWSKTGIGFWLSQKHCKCEGGLPGCCDDGWRIVLAGSRFLKKSEKNYAPVEGEALGVAWSLEQTHYFTMGCDNLLLVVDHRPLLQLLGDRRLDEIDNPRLFRLKQRTLRWRFDVQYQPGKLHFFADAASRHPSAKTYLIDDCSVNALISGPHKKMVVTIDEVRSETRKDKTLECVVRHILTNRTVTSTKKGIPPAAQVFWAFRDELSVIDGLVMYRKRIVIPEALRQRVLENLHSAHQGTAAMISRAQSMLFWPGFSKDIERMRQNCRVCNLIAPSQAKLPPVCPKLPKVPFEMVYADYCDLDGKHYLVVGDRLSGWTEILKIDPGECSGSKGLCKALRTLFSTFGIPAEISSDGGPEFISKATEAFLKSWGVEHRLSSVCFPQSNGRAELAVKATKRLLRGNVDSDGSLNTDNLVRALLQLRNTPDRDCKLSPAEILFGHPLNDSLPVLDKTMCIFDNDQIHDHWHQAWAAKEAALRSRLVHSCESLEDHCKELDPLMVGDSVFIQNQYSSSKNFKKWDKQGVVIEVGKNDQYLIRVNGTGRMTLRNRRFLRRFKERTLHISSPSTPDISSSQASHIPHDTVSKVDDASVGKVADTSCNTQNNDSDSDMLHSAVEPGFMDDYDEMFGEADNSEEFFGFPSHVVAEPENKPSQPTHESEDSNNDSAHQEDGVNGHTSSTPIRRSMRRRYKTKQYNASSGKFE